MALVAHPLINSDRLAERLRRSPAPVVLDVRWSLSGGADRAAYDVAHIPGAVFVDFGHDICGQPGDAGRHPLPETGALQDALRRAGVDEGDDVIVVDGGDLLPAARTWWTLRWAGIESVRVLDGGMARWDGPTEVTATTTVTGTVVVRRGDLEALDANEALVRARAGARRRSDGCTRADPFDAVGRPGSARRVLWIRSDGGADGARRSERRRPSRPVRRIVERMDHRSTATDRHRRRRAGSRFLTRERQRECRAVARLAADADRATVRFGDGLDDRKSEAGAAW